MLTYQIKRETCIINDSAILPIYDVYAGDDPRDYARLGFRPMSRIKSFRTMAEAEAFVATRET